MSEGKEANSLLVERDLERLANRESSRPELGRALKLCSPALSKIRFVFLRRAGKKRPMESG